MPDDIFGDIRWVMSFTAQLTLAITVPYSFSDLRVNDMSFMIILGSHTYQVTSD